MVYNRYIKYTIVEFEFDNTKSLKIGKSMVLISLNPSFYGKIRIALSFRPKLRMKQGIF